MRSFLLSPVLLSLLAGCGSVATPDQAPSWPKRVTISAKLGASDGEGLQLSDGTVVPGVGDLKLYQAMVLSLRAPSPDSICEKGNFEALEDIPTDQQGCPAGLPEAWAMHAYLSAATLHASNESSAIGLGLLVRDQAHTALYRLRIVGDSYNAEGVSTATFDYAPVP